MKGHRISVNHHTRRYIRQSRRTASIIRAIALLATVLSCVSIVYVVYSVERQYEDYDNAVVELKKTRASLESAIRKSADESAVSDDTVASVYKPSLDSLRSNRLSAMTILDRHDGHELSCNDMFVSGMTNSIRHDISEMRNRTNAIISDSESVNHGIKSKAIMDARDSMETMIRKAEALLSASDGNVHDASVRDSLSNSVRAAKARTISVSADEMKRLTDEITSKMSDVSKSVNEYQKEIERKAQEAKEKAEEEAKVKADEERKTQSHGSNANGNNSVAVVNNSPSSDDVTSNRSNTSHIDYGYNYAGQCFSASECQRSIDSAGYNQIWEYKASDGSTYYEIHNYKGGSSMWGKNSMTINGVKYNLGAWVKAPYINGVPHGLATVGKYAQTCGPDNKVWFAPIL